MTTGFTSGNFDISRAAPAAIAEKIKSICIIGGGNIGMALAAEIGKNTKAKITLLTSKSSAFGKTILSIDTDKNKSVSGELFLATNDYEEALAGADVVFVTVPAFIIQDVTRRIKLRKKAVIILVPGSGGREFYFKTLADQGHLVAGLDRVPFIARISEPGKTVIAFKKDRIRFALLNAAHNVRVQKIVSDCLDIQAESITNYLNITFTPSNQILHTTRLYSLFSGKTINDSFSRQIKFYAEWDDVSSDYLLSADYELQNICKAYNLSAVIPLKIHYESGNAHELTQKLRTIKSLNNIDAPLLFKDSKYFIDPASRYFQEDFPFGLFMIKDFAAIANIDTPVIDKITKWYASFFNLDYFRGDELTGNDAKRLPLPRSFGMNSIADVNNFYIGNVKRHITKKTRGKNKNSPQERAGVLV
jgi:hypothetical protein